MKMKHIVLYSLLFILAFIFIIIDLGMGADVLNVKDIIVKTFTEATFTIQQQTLLSTFRMPRVITACLVGSALGVGGLLMQSFFRNPLAGPYVLGIGSGASLGVSLFIMGGSLGLFFTTSNAGLVSFGFLGAFSVLFCIGLLSFRFRSNVSVLIIGLMFSYFTSSIVSLMQYWSHPELVKQFAVWGMGTYTEVEYKDLWILGSCIGIGLILAWSQSLILNAFYLSNFEVEALGFSIKKSRWIIFISVALLVASSTAFCGPVAFLGMAIPHFARLLFRNSDHRLLIPQCILLGIACSLSFDILSQNPWSQSPIPLNTISSFLGAPIVVYLLWKRKSL